MADHNGRYILDDQGNVMPCPDLLEWGAWFETAGEKRRVALDKVGDWTVSTVFLGFDQSWCPDPMADPLNYKPVLWETMAFDCIHNGQMMLRYNSREAALTGHRGIVAIVREK